MLLTKERKEMIKQIAKGDIYDFKSFIELYYRNEKILIDKYRIENLKKMDFEKNKSSIESYANSFLGKTWKKRNDSDQKNICEIFNMKESIYNKEGIYNENDINIFLENLNDYSVNEVDFIIKLGDEYTYNILNKYIYLINDFTYLEDFLCVWEYLDKNEFVVFDDYKNTSLKKYFLKNDIKKIDSNISTKPYDTLFGIVQNDSMNYRYGYKNSDMDYLELDITFNEDAYIKYEKLLNKKIVPLPSINSFIERKFKDFNEYKFKKTTRIIYSILAITTLISGVSMFFSINSNKSNKEIWKTDKKAEHKTEEQLVVLLDQLVSNSKNQTEMIKSLSEKIEKLNSEKMSDVEADLIDYLDENEKKNNDIINIIKQIKVDTTSIQRDTTFIKTDTKPIKTKSPQKLKAIDILK